MPCARTGWAELSVASEAIYTTHFPIFALFRRQSTICIHQKDYNKRKMSYAELFGLMIDSLEEPMEDLEVKRLV